VSSHFDTNKKNIKTVGFGQEVNWMAVMG